MGRPWIVATPEHERAFIKDWTEYGLTMAEMKALHGFKSDRGVYQTARRLGLPRRRPRRIALVGGHWERHGLTMVWVEHLSDDSKAS